MEHHALLRIAEWLGERNRIDVHQHWAVVRLAGADQHGQRPAASLAGVVHLVASPPRERPRAWLAGSSSGAMPDGSRLHVVIPDDSNWFADLRLPVQRSAELHGRRLC